MAKLLTPPISSETLFCHSIEPLTCTLASTPLVTNGDESPLAENDNDSIPEMKIAASDPVPDIKNPIKSQLSEDVENNSPATENNIQKEAPPVADSKEIEDGVEKIAESEAGLATQGGKNNPEKSYGFRSRAPINYSERNMETISITPEVPKTRKPKTPQKNDQNKTKDQSFHLTPNVLASALLNNNQSSGNTVLSTNLAASFTNLVASQNNIPISLGGVPNIQQMPGSNGVINIEDDEDVVITQVIKHVQQAVPQIPLPQPTVVHQQPSTSANNQISNLLRLAGRIKELVDSTSQNHPRLQQLENLSNLLQNQQHQQQASPTIQHQQASPAIQHQQASPTIQHQQASPTIQHQQASPTIQQPALQQQLQQLLQAQQQRQSNPLSAHQSSMQQNLAQNLQNMSQNLQSLSRQPQQFSNPQPPQQQASNINVNAVVQQILQAVMNPQKPIQQQPMPMSSTSSALSANSALRNLLQPGLSNSSFLSQTQQNPPSCSRTQPSAALLNSQRHVVNLQQRASQNFSNNDIAQKLQALQEQLKARQHGKTDTPATRNELANIISSIMKLNHFRNASHNNKSNAMFNSQLGNSTGMKLKSPSLLKQIQQSHRAKPANSWFTLKGSSSQSQGRVPFQQFSNQQRKRPVPLIDLSQTFPIVHHSKEKLQLLAVVGLITPQQRHAILLSHAHRKRRLEEARLEIENSKKTRKRKKKGGTENEADPDGPDTHDNYCSKCRMAGELLMCDKCPRVFHLFCLEPPLAIVPEGEWFCNKCQAEKDAEESMDVNVIDIIDDPQVDIQSKTELEDLHRQLQKMRQATLDLQNELDTSADVT